MLQPAVLNSSSNNNNSNYSQSPEPVLPVGMTMMIHHPSKRKTQLCLLAISLIVFVVCSWTFFWAMEEQQYAPFTTNVEDRTLSTDKSNTTAGSYSNNNRNGLLLPLKQQQELEQQQQQPMGALKIPDLTFTLNNREPYDQNLVDRSVAFMQDAIMEEDDDNEGQEDSLLDGTQRDEEEEEDEDDNEDNLDSDLVPLCTREQIMDGKWLPRV
jgi:nitrogen fixation-related uncharacterized protein